MTSKLRITLIVLAAGLAPLASCSAVDPLDTSLAKQSPAVSPVTTDQSAIAQVVGSAEEGVSPLAWANPSTGSTGVIRQVGPGPESQPDCKSFVTTRLTLSGEAILNGLACHSSGSDWKVVREGAES